MQYNGKVTLIGALEFHNKKGVPAKTIGVLTSTDFISKEDMRYIIHTARRVFCAYKQSYFVKVNF